MSLVVLNLAGSVAILGWLYYRRGRARNVLLCVAAVFVFFAFGPLVNLVLGEPTNQGIVETKIGLASTGFLLAMTGMALADLVRPQRQTFGPARPASTRTYELLPLILFGLAGYALFVLATQGWAMLGADKLERIELAGVWHYPYLLVENFATAMYFIARRSALTYTAYLVNAVLYMAYCLVTTERDFLFIGFALFVQAQLFNTSGRSRRVVLFGVAGLVLAGGLAASREGKDFGVTQTLNQGSIPFVDTYVMNAVPQYLPFRDGQTYVDAATGHRQETGPLDQWLVNLYTPGSPSGYGFSLTAEAYLNFGLLGIPALFFLLGLAQRFVVNRSDRSDWWTFLSVLFTAALLNALRGDSAQLVKTVAYAAVFFALIHLLSSPHEQVPPAAPRAGRPARTGNA